MKEQALKTINAYYLFIEKTKMPPSAYYLYITEQRPEVTKSMKKSHMMEISKMEKNHMRENSKQLTDMWLKLDPDSK